MTFISPEYHTRKIVKKFGGIFLYLAFILSGIWFLVAPQTCNLPRLYSVGEIDKSFDYSERELLTVIQKAEEVWENGLGRNVFEFDSQKGLPVSLVYDDRQARTDEIEILNSSLSDLEQQRESVQQRFSSLKEAYNVLFAEYGENVRQYESDVAEFNKTVEYWNNKKGASKDAHKLIQKEQKELEQKQAQLKIDQLEINRIADQLNSAVDNDRAIVTKYNLIVNSVEEIYGEVTLFDRASYSPEGINVFEFPDEDILLLSLVHEMGHYLGVEHIEDNRAIMHYLMKDQDLSEIKITDADRVGFDLVCPTEKEGYFSRIKT